MSVNQMEPLFPPDSLLPSQCVLAVAAAAAAAASGQVIEALEKASKVAKPPVSALFSDVYADMPWHLQEQLQETLQVARRHPHLCPPDMPVQ